MHRVGADSNNVVPTSTSSVCSNVKSPPISTPSPNNISSTPTSISEAIYNASKPIINTNKVITSSPLHNNRNAAPILSSPKRKELGPSCRPVINNKDIINNITSPSAKEIGPPGLIHSRSGSNLLARNSYDCKIAGLYDLEETLGRGHFAVVKLARHVFTGEKVAVKVIDKTKLDEVSRAHLFQEVRCMKLVQHPNVVRLYEVIDTQTKLYLILELADGGDLYDYIMRHDEGLGEDQARNYFRQIVHAISYCHKLHVVHRDLKPENVVFFERLGMVKLTDFGFSNRFNPGQKLETSCGSLAYSAPEILLGDSYDAPAVDVWSLGVILYMLVCGHAPFQEANDSETLTMIMDCKYSIPAYISPACKKLISRMLIREPERRASLEELASDPWLLEGSGMMPAEYLPLISREHVSEEDHAHILQKMVNGKIATKEEILDALDKNEYNHITATYFLLAERKLRAHRQEQAQKAAGGSNSMLATSPATQTLAASSPSPLLLSPGLVKLPSSHATKPPILAKINVRSNPLTSHTKDKKHKSNLSTIPASPKIVPDNNNKNNKNRKVLIKSSSSLGFGSTRSLPIGTMKMKSKHNSVLGITTAKCLLGKSKSSSLITTVTTITTTENNVGLTKSSGAVVVANKNTPQGLLYLWSMGKPLQSEVPSYCCIS